MTDPETQRLLGDVQGRLETIQLQLVGNEAEAAKSRKALYAQISDTRKEIQDARNRTAALETLMKEEDRPAVRMLSDWRSRALGGMAVLGVIGAIILLILGAAREAIIEIGRAIFAR